LDVAFFALAAFLVATADFATVFLAFAVAFFAVFFAGFAVALAFAFFALAFLGGTVAYLLPWTLAPPRARFEEKLMAPPWNPAKKTKSLVNFQGEWDIFYMPEPKLRSLQDPEAAFPKALV